MFVTQRVTLKLLTDSNVKLGSRQFVSRRATTGKNNHEIRGMNSAPGGCQLVGYNNSKTEGGEIMMMNLLKRLVVEEEGQGLVEYTLIVLLVALVFWVAVKNTNIGEQLTASWGDVKTCLEDPQGAACGSGS